MQASDDVVKAAVLAEREACATFLEHGIDLKGLTSSPELQCFIADLLACCASTIRARGTYASQ